MASTTPATLANDTAITGAADTASHTTPANGNTPAAGRPTRKPLKRRRCTECGAEFWTRYKAYTCSDKCRRKRARRLATKGARNVARRVTANEAEK